jgi:hypothetical protein
MNRLVLISLMMILGCQLVSGGIDSEQSVSDLLFNKLRQEVEPALLDLLKSSSYVEKTVLANRVNRANAVLAEFTRLLQREVQPSTTSLIPTATELAASSKKSIAPTKSTVSNKSESPPIEHRSPPF